MGRTHTLCIYTCKIHTKSVYSADFTITASGSIINQIVMIFVIYLKIIASFGVHFIYRLTNYSVSCLFGNMRY